MTWSCSYCRRLNDGVHTCDGCGAPPEAPPLRWIRGVGALPKGSWNDPVKEAAASKVRNRPPRPRPPKAMTM